MGVRDERSNNRGYGVCRKTDSFYSEEVSRMIRYRKSSSEWSFSFEEWKALPLGNVCKSLGIKAPSSEKSVEHLSRAENGSERETSAKP